jgi:acetate kinase
MSGSVLLTFNPGSSTIKLGLFVVKEGSPRRLGTGSIDLRQDPLSLHVVEGSETTNIPMKAAVTDDLHEVIDETLKWLAGHFSLSELAAVGQRVVHGRRSFRRPHLNHRRDSRRDRGPGTAGPAASAAKRQADQGSQPSSPRSAANCLV